VKKIEKNGVIFKLLFEWIMLYYERKIIFDDYYMKFKYTMTHLQSELSNLSEHSKELEKEEFREDKLRDTDNTNNAKNNFKKE
jgi:hypothetical protein